MNYWHIVTADAFKKGKTVDGDLYFLSDTKEIYRGAVPFTESVELYTDMLPLTPTSNKLYINSNTLEGRIYVSNSWKIVIHAVMDAVENETESPVTGAAVINYVATEITNLLKTNKVIKSIAWTKSTHTVDVTKGDNSVQNIKIDGLGANINYNKNTGALDLVDVDNTVLGTINLDLERFVNSGEYDASTKDIILYFDKEKKDFVKIPAGELVDTYTATATNTIDLKVEKNAFSGEVKLSAEANNAITKKSDGIHVDISKKMDLQAASANGNLSKFNDKGQTVDSGIKADTLNTLITRLTVTNI